ncbi:hypothetical protein BD413DRAFT_609635 [Trametes elegans]|nr:hypothetical protein BD413DRAFT_609635 [Trametes elegans]
MDAEGALASSRNASTSFIRVVALSIAFYDYLLTLPAEWRFYRSQRSWRLSLGCILFIAIRYSSIAVLTLSNVGYFGNFFTPAACSRYFIAAPIFKVLQAMISQLILGIRTINISRRSRSVTWIITTVFLLCTTAQWILNLWNRVPVQGRRNNCTAGNKPPVLTVWLYYLLAMAFDILTLSISSVYLISFNPNSGKMAHLRRIMLTDGLVYFVALTGVNIFNLILYRRPDEAAQSSGVSLGYALTWIMSQRILIHLRAIHLPPSDAAAAHNRTVTTQVVVSRVLPSAQSVSRAMRSQFEPKDRHHHHRWRRSARTRADGVLSSGFDLDLGSGADFDWSATSSCCSSSCSSSSSSPAATSCRHCREGDARSSRPDGDVEKGASAGACPREWAPDRPRARVSVESGVTPVANATLDAHRRGADPGGRESDEEEEVPVRVQIEETVTVEVEYDPDAFAQESYRTPRLLWEVLMLSLFL